eukprot:13380692-Heterocapsa_arctica.AAC.1
MERDLQQNARPLKRRREQENEMNREEDNDEMIDYPEGFDVNMEEKNKTWERRIGVPATYIEQLEGLAQTSAKTDTYIVDCNSGVRMWRICRNPKCYRCSIIEKAELTTEIPMEK